MISSFRVNYTLKNVTLKILNFLYLFHGLSFYIFEKKIGVTILIKLTTSPQISRILQYKTLRSVMFVMYIKNSEYDHENPPS